VRGSAVLPAMTCTTTGRLERLQSRPKTICSLPFLQSREWPCAASGQWWPLNQVELTSASTRPAAATTGVAMLLGPQSKSTYRSQVVVRAQRTEINALP